MGKKYRKIIVHNKEYDWLYIKTYDSIRLTIFIIEYTNNGTVRKRRFLSQFEMKDYCEDNINSYDVIMTPKIVKKFIEHYYKPNFGSIITQKLFRKQKLKKINGIYFS
jgi:hypothetical protein